MNKKIIVGIIVLVLLAGMVCADENADILRLKSQLEKDMKIVQKSVERLPDDDPRKERLTAQLKQYTSAFLRLPSERVVRGKTISLKSDIIAEVDRTLKLGTGPQFSKELPKKPDTGIAVYYDEHDYWIAFMPDTPYYRLRYLDDAHRGPLAQEQDKLFEDRVLRLTQHKAINVKYIAEDRPTKTDEKIEMAYSVEAPSCMIIENGEGKTKGDVSNIQFTIMQGSCTAGVNYDVKLKFIYQDPGTWQANDKLIEITWRVRFVEAGAKELEELDKEIKDGYAYLDNGMIDEAQEIETGLRKYYKAAAGAKMTPEQEKKYESFRDRLVEGYVFEIDALLSKNKFIEVDALFKKVIDEHYFNWCFDKSRPCQKLIDDISDKEVYVSRGLGIIKVIVTDEAGKVLPRVKAEVFEEDGTTSRDIDCLTDKEGSCALDSVAAEASVIIFTLNDYETLNYDVKLGAGQTKEVRVKLIPNELARAKFTLRVLVDGERAKNNVKLNMVYADGSILDPEVAVALKGTIAAKGAVTTDATGNLVLTLWKPGQIIITPDTGDYEKLTPPATVTLVKDTPVNVDINAVSKESNRGLIIVSVRDEETGQAIRDVPIGIVDSKGNSIALGLRPVGATSITGLIETNGKIPEGDYMVKITTGMYNLMDGANAVLTPYEAYLSDSVSVVAGRDAYIDVKLKRTPTDVGTLQGVVTVEGQSPGTRIILELIGDSGHRVIIADVNGNIKDKKVEEGSYRIKRTGEATYQEIDPPKIILVVAGKPTDVSVDLKLVSSTKGNLEGTITVDGAVKEEEFRLTNVAIGFDEKVKSVPGGNYVKKDLAKGTYHISADTAKYEPVSIDIEIKGGAMPTKQDVNLVTLTGDKGTLEGAVTVEGAGPGPNIKFKATSKGVTTNFATDGAGKYTVKLKPGSYQIQVDDGNYLPLPVALGIEIRKGETTPMEITLKPVEKMVEVAGKGFIGGRVINSESKKVIEAFFVSAVDSEGKTIAEMPFAARTDGSFSYELTRAGKIKIGKYDVTVSTDKYVSKTIKDVEIKAAGYTADIGNVELSILSGKRTDDAYIKETVDDNVKKIEGKARSKVGEIDHLKKMAIIYIKAYKAGTDVAENEKRINKVINKLDKIPKMLKVYEDLAKEKEKVEGKLITDEDVNKFKRDFIDTADAKLNTLITEFDAITLP